MEAVNVRDVISSLDSETKRQLAFELLKEVLNEKKSELEHEVEELKREEEKLLNHLELIQRKKEEFMPEYERLTKILNALDYATENVQEKLRIVRDKLRIAEDKFNRYISRLEKALANA